ncbi:unnamed protein product [Psylliodes chrysocephalus]|uniref:Uncharacterized protein n=1 Tax=Psylliodes chrysocephalus TaxID=3402493 RepID=A0A9P0GFF2_9CUCU|nr:unnamed protein product [Psylliodes chrysocephala]
MAIKQVVILESNNMSVSQINTNSPVKEENNSQVKEENGSPVKEEHNSPVKEEHNSPVKEEHNSPVKEEYNSPVTKMVEMKVNSSVRDISSLEKVEIGAISNIKSIRSVPAFINVFIENVQFNIEVDTGASVSLMS